MPLRPNLPAPSAGGCLVNQEPEAMATLSLPEARELITDVMLAAGHAQADAAVIADHLIDCELRGLPFGGLARALSITERIRATPEPPGPIRVVADTPVSATIDGGDQVGYLVGLRATELGIRKAREQGIAVVGARNTWYTGMFSYYLERAADAGLAGMIAGSGPAVVAPYGGTEPRFCTNPVAFGFPARPHPVIWDIGTSSVMLGEVMLRDRLGQELEPGQAYDATGAPTLDPAAALKGAFAVWGGHKGSGLALVVQLLGMMTGAAADPPGMSDVGMLAVFIDPAVLTDPVDYRRRAGAFADQVRATRPVSEGSPVRVPFDRSRTRRAETLQRGVIDVPASLVAALHRETIRNLES
jgi:LDH2 family malate/lactate/ureidoglycolate dehydrogenase